MRHQDRIRGEEADVCLVSSKRNLLPRNRIRLAGKTIAACRHQSGMSTKFVHEHPECRSTGPPVDVTTWRRCRLIEVGFRPDLADAVARDRRIDLHALLGLVDRGCPPALALRILAPVESSA